MGLPATEVEWRQYGFAGAQLGYLLNGAGFFHQAHRAVDDCHALLEILAVDLPVLCWRAGACAAAGAGAQEDDTGLGRAVALRPQGRPQARGYRWSDGSDGRPRSWYVDVDESKLDDEIAFLKTEIYLQDVEPRLQALTAFDRFSVKA